MIHGEKACVACRELFTPGAHLTSKQADETHSCSPSCASAAAHGRLRFRSQTSGSRHDEGRCVCESCQAIRTEDRSAAIIAYARERGLSVALGPKAKRTKEEMARIAAKIRAARREYSETREVI